MMEYWLDICIRALNCPTDILKSVLLWGGETLPLYTQNFRTVCSLLIHLFSCVCRHKFMSQPVWRVLMNISHFHAVYSLCIRCVEALKVGEMHLYFTITITTILDKVPAHCYTWHKKVQSCFLINPQESKCRFAPSSSNSCYCSLM